MSVNAAAAAFAGPACSIPRTGECPIQSLHETTTDLERGVRKKTGPKPGHWLHTANRLISLCSVRALARSDQPSPIKSPMTGPYATTRPANTTETIEMSLMRMLSEGPEVS